MQYLETYLRKIIERGNPQLAESIEKTAKEISQVNLENFSFASHEVGLLFGNVQSGKTGQMFGVISAATDLGFPLFIILTTDNIVLHQQTIDRVREDLDGYCVCGENDSEVFAENQLMMPTIVVLKKNYRTLRQWSNILASTGFVMGNPLFVIDDEADAASLNTLVNKERQSSINRYLDEIKRRSASSIYLQVTGTPQALLLQTVQSGWHPYFTYYFRPGEAYLSGDFFFTKKKSPCIALIDEMEEPLHNALANHLTASAQILLSGGKVCNFLIHPSVRKAIHSRFEQNVSRALDKFTDEITDGTLRNRIKQAYDGIAPAKSTKLPFEAIYKYICALLTDKQIKTFLMNTDTSVSSVEYSSGSNIVIGGNTLGRGVTFPGLQTIYYTRTAKKPQADTMWQHSRMFGYDRDAGMMKVFIDEHLYKLFADINATNNSIIAQVEKGVDSIKIYYPACLNPTRKNVLDNSKVFALSGGTNYFPQNPTNNTIEDISRLLEPFSDVTEYHQVNIRLIKEVLTHVKSLSDFRVSSFTSIIDMLLSEKPVCQGILIVRRGRNVAKGTGALLSSSDWILSNSFPTSLVLTMYQMTGDKGWGGHPIWVPNIKLPDNVVYYDVDDDVREE
jgi:hypothetical protein